MIFATTLSARELTIYTYSSFTSSWGPGPALKESFEAQWNGCTVTQGWSETYDMFLEGEADYVLSYTNSPAYHMVAEETDRYQAAFFSEGDVTQIEVAAVSAHSNQGASGNGL
jgi:ABC-type thiamine transport system substrate-binding protein